MFDLEQSIVEWRRQMLAAGIKAPVPLEELEGHLREEIEAQIRLGIRGQQAFEAAVLKIGRAQELKTEFFRADWLRSFLEMKLSKETQNSFTIPAVCMGATNLAIGIMIVGKLGEMRTMTFFEQMSAVAALVVATLLFSSGVWGRRFFPVIPRKPARIGIGAVLTAVIGLWMMIFLTYINYDIGRFMAAFCWAFFVPMGALGGIILGLEGVAQKHSLLKSYV